MNTSCLAWRDGRWTLSALDRDGMMWLWFAHGLGPALSILRGARNVWLEVTQ